MKELIWLCMSYLAQSELKLFLGILIVDVSLKVLHGEWAVLVLSINPVFI